MTSAPSELGRRALMTGTAGCLVGASWPAHAAKLKPLSAKQRKILEAIPSDPPPKKLTGDQHFLVSDEYHPERFREQIRDLGGVYVGVGPEQNYLYAGWARPGILILLDFDQMVVELHGVYRALFLAADGPMAFRKLWKPKQSGRALAVLAESPVPAGEDEARYRERLRRVYIAAHKMVDARMQILTLRHRALKVDSFINDQAQYDHIRQLFATGRARLIRGDLTKDKAMNGVAKAAKALKEPVRCLYISNVELYFDYESGLGDNCRVQPSDQRSLILRTVFKSTKAHDRYHYCVQRLDHFREWLDTGVNTVNAMMKKADARIQKDKDAWVIPGP